MKQVRFYMANKKEYLFDEETAEMILDQEEQIVRLADKDGKWTGESLNKAHLVCTDVDWIETRQESRRENKDHLLEEPDKDVSQIKHFLKIYKPEFLKNKKNENIQAGNL